MAKKQKIFWAILIGGLFLLCLIPRVLLALGIPLPRLGPAPHQALKCRNRLTGESIAIPPGAHRRRLCRRTKHLFYYRFELRADGGADGGAGRAAF